MSYQAITQYNSPNYTPFAQVAAIFGRARTIEAITVHWWGNPNTNPTFENVVAWFSNPASQVSAHEVATGTGRRSATMVDYPNAAYHTGNAIGNASTLGLELDPRCRDEDYDVGAEVIADIWVYYGKLPLRPHKSWVPTTCPGNYDLDRLQREAEVWYVKKTNQVPKATEDQIRQAYRDVLEREIDKSGEAHYFNSNMTIAEVRADLLASDEYKQLLVKKAAEAAKQEWIRNLVDIEDTKLYVLPNNGTSVVNLQTLDVLPNTVIPKNTAVDIAKQTTVKGKAYYITNYSVAHNISNGILASDLGQLPKPPDNEKPEWLKNLKDVEDTTMYTRSATPVINLADGSIKSVLDMGKPVEVSMSTEIVGKQLMVMKGTEQDGKYQGIELIYLSDKPINPDTGDVEKRLSALEQIIKTITDFLDRVFKSWRK